MTDAAIEADKVTSLPGFDGTLPSTHYSGYLPTGVKTGSAGMLHYWVIESENNPKTDPVVLWYNGGTWNGVVNFAVLIQAHLP
jgi:carboxypeptidase C (cathepsin A)